MMRDTRRGFFKALAALACAPALPVPTGYRPVTGQTVRLPASGLVFPGALRVSEELLDDMPGICTYIDGRLIAMTVAEQLPDVLRRHGVR